MFSAFLVASAVCRLLECCKAHSVSGFPLVASATSRLLVCCKAHSVSGFPRIIVIAIVTATIAHHNISTESVPNKLILRKLDSEGLAFANPWNCTIAAIQAPFKNARSSPDPIVNNSRLYREVAAFRICICSAHPCICLRLPACATSCVYARACPFHYLAGCLLCQIQVKPICAAVCSGPRCRVAMLFLRSVAIWRRALLGNVCRRTS